MDSTSSTSAAPPVACFSTDPKMSALEEDSQTFQAYSQLPATVSVVEFTKYDLDDLFSIQLSDETMSKLGEVGDEEDEAAHKLAMTLNGRRVLVHFVDEPSEYYVDKDAPTTCVLRPATSTRHGNGPAVLIDPRALLDPLQLLPDIKISDQPRYRGDKGEAAGSESGGPATKTGKTSTTSMKNSSASAKKSSSAATASSSKKASGSGKTSAGTTSGGDDDGSDDDLPNFFSGGGGKGSRGNYTSYNAGVSTAVEMQTKLPQMPISAVELMTFFPHHTQWRAVMLRLFRNGWSTVDMAKLQLHARNSLDIGEWARRRNALRHQLRSMCRDKYGAGQTGNVLKYGAKDNAGNLVTPPHADFAAFVDAASGDNHDLYDTRLPVQISGDRYQPPRNKAVLDSPALVHQLLNGVVNFPQGQDAGLLTQALLWCQTNGELQRDTDYLPTVVSTQNFVLPADSLNNDWDTEAQLRMVSSVANPTT